MPPSAITNSLLRLDGATGLPPSPFERPNDKMDFFVLELGLHNDVASLCTRTAEALRMHAEFLHQMRGAGAKASLFVESASPVVRFEASFLSILAEAGIALEYSHENA